MLLCLERICYFFCNEMGEDYYFVAGGESQTVEFKESFTKAAIETITNPEVGFFLERFVKPYRESKPVSKRLKRYNS